MARRSDGIYQRGKTWRGALLSALLVALPAEVGAECEAEKARRDEKAGS
jgi:hypothetical protein